MQTLLLLLLAAPPQFEVKAATPAEREHRARVRCGGAVDALVVKGDVGTYACHDAPGADVTDVLGTTELVVRGRVSKIETPPAKQFGDPAPAWRLATVKVARTLKGTPVSEVKFLFISSVKDGNEIYRKVKQGQEGVWLLSRQPGSVKELMVLTSLEDQPASAEDYLRELLAAAACPAKLEGKCEYKSTVCPRADATCTCEAVCPGGAALPPNFVLPMRWVCRPNACATAKEGEPCAPDGMACEGCWGTHPWTCENGRWAFHDIPPPP